MVRVKILIFFVVFLSVATGGVYAETILPYSMHWIDMELEVSGDADIVPADRGNYIEWQHEATMRAQSRLMRNFVQAMSYLRIDAYNFFRDLLMREVGKNEVLFEYAESYKRSRIRYSDNSVHITKAFPLFGEKGFAWRLITTGADTGNFPDYEEYVFSAPFTGLVIDARGIGRLPSLCPRVFDELHQTLYSIDLIEKEAFQRWGAVQFTDDPDYSRFKERVGQNPYRVVALENTKLIETDITISNEDAKILLQSDITRKNLMEGKVLIVIDGLSEITF
jgi:hypothetical protein